MAISYQDHSTVSNISRPAEDSPIVAGYSHFGGHEQGLRLRADRRGRPLSQAARITSLNSSRPKQPCPGDSPPDMPATDASLRRP